MDRGCRSVKRCSLHWIYADHRLRGEIGSLPTDGLRALGLPRYCQAKDQPVLPPLCVLSRFGISKLFISDQNPPRPGELHHGL